MKHALSRDLAGLIVFALPLALHAQEITAIRVEPGQTSIGQTVDILIDLNKHDQESFTCGAQLSLGDGKTRNLRLTEKDTPYRTSYKYANAGNYVVTVEGKFQARGLNSAAGCDVSAKPIAVLVQADPGLQSTAPAQLPTQAGASPSPIQFKTGTARQIVRDAIAAFAVDKDAYKARAAYQEALQIDPDYLPALVGLAMAYEAWGDWENARQVFIKVNQKARPGALAEVSKREIAMLDARMRMPPTAENRLQQEYNNLLNEARLYLLVGQPRLAVERSNAARILDETRWEAYALTGQIAMDMGLKSEARRLFQDARARTKEVGVREKLILAAASSLGKDALCEGCDITRAELTQYATSVFDEALHEIENGYGSGFKNGMPATTAGIGHRLERTSYIDSVGHGGFQKNMGIYSYLGTDKKHERELQRRSLEVLKPLFLKFKAALRKKGYRFYIEENSPYMSFESTGPKGMPAVNASAGSDTGPLFISIYRGNQEGGGEYWKQILGSGYHQNY